MQKTEVASMQKKYDVIIAGAGPAGLMAAQVLGKKGFSVLLVDIKKDIARVYRACCANLIIEPGTHREWVTYAGGAFHFAENKFSVPYSGRVIPLKRSVKISAGGKTLVIAGNSPEGYVAVSFEKETLLQGMLAHAAADKNIEIMPETQALGAENTAGGVAVRLRSGGSAFTAHGRYAVAADGVNSSIVESLGLNTTRRTFFARFMATSYHMEGVNCPYPDSWITFMGKGHTLGGRGQIYMCPKPHGGATDKAVYELTVGVPALGPPAHSAQQEIDHFIKQGNFSSWFKHARIIDRRAAALNFFTPLGNPVEGNVVVVGDAAAFIETYVQGAIMYGYQAALAVSKQLATGAGIDEYARSWKSSFEYNDPKEIKLATQGFGLHVLDDGDIDYLFSLTAGDDIRGFVNEFSDPLTVRSALYSHMEQIERERPGLAAKLKRFSDVSVADALQIGSS
jgi:digeranylgeranylglycerophospholipid reductase